MGCSNKEIVEIIIENPYNKESGDKIIEVPAEQILKGFRSDYFYITNERGEEIISQLTHDNLILIKAEVSPHNKIKYFVHPSDTVHLYKTLVYGDFYPARRDDIAYENELGGYRIYGPGTQKAGEESFGYDIFFKYPTEEIVLPQLYAAQTSSENWKKVDSLKKIDSILASKFEESFTYHLDHGKGMDSYAVGSTLGAGAPALLINDTIKYPWCYESAAILDNGPLRFTVKLSFAPEKISETNEIKEHRIIQLDAGSYFNRSKVFYEGLEEPQRIVSGFPLRDDSKVVELKEKGIISYSAPAQNIKYGRANLALKFTNIADSIYHIDRHILLSTILHPNDTLDYKWGFAWDKKELPDPDSLIINLEEPDRNYLVKIKKSNL